MSISITAQDIDSIKSVAIKAYFSSRLVLGEEYQIGGKESRPVFIQRLHFQDFIVRVVIGDKCYAYTLSEESLLKARYVLTDGYDYRTDKPLEFASNTATREILNALNNFCNLSSVHNPLLKTLGIT